MKKILLLLVFLAISANTINAQQCACCTEKHGEFNFWIGKWDVTLPNGKFAGKNEIKHIQNKCILQENWKSASPSYTGTSNNFYNYTTKQWEQIWVDNQGSSLHLKGNKVGNQMILQTDEAKNKDGDMFIHKVTWTDNEDGTVRQVWETITQTKDGETTAVVFDGLYKPSK